MSTDMSKQSLPKPGNIQNNLDCISTFLNGVHTLHTICTIRKFQYHKISIGGHLSGLSCGAAALLCAYNNATIPALITGGFMLLIAKHSFQFTQGYEEYKTISAELQTISKIIKGHTFRSHTEVERLADAVRNTTVYSYARTEHSLEEFAQLADTLRYNKTQELNNIISKLESQK